MAKKKIFVGAWLANLNRLYNIVGLGVQYTDAFGEVCYDGVEVDLYAHNFAHDNTVKPFARIVIPLSKARSLQSRENFDKVIDHQMTLVKKLHQTSQALTGYKFNFDLSMNKMKQEKACITIKLTEKEFLNLHGLIEKELSGS